MPIPNKRKLERARREAAAAREETSRIRRVVAELPKPPPDPKRFTAPAEVAEFHRQWAEWHASLSEEQRAALRAAHARATLQSGTPRR